MRLVPLEGVVSLARRDEGVAWTFVSDVFVAAHDPTVSVVSDQAVSEVELELALTDLARVLERLELHDFKVVEIELNLRVEDRNVARVCEEVFQRVELLASEAAIVIVVPLPVLLNLLAQVVLVDAFANGVDLVGRVAVDGQAAAKQVHGGVIELVKVAGIGNVSFVSAIDIVVHQCVFRCVSMWRLWYSVQKLATKGGPRRESTFAVESGKESALLTPHKVVMLVAHTNKVDCVQMGQRDHRDCVVVLLVGEALRVHVVLNEVAEATRGSCDFVALDLASQQGLDVQHVETFFVVVLALLLIIGKLVSDSDAIKYAIRAEVDKLLVHLLSIANLAVAEAEGDFSVFIEDLNLVLRHLYVAIGVFVELIIGQVVLLEDWLFVDLVILFAKIGTLALLYLVSHSSSNKRTNVILIFDQVYFLDVFRAANTILVDREVFHIFTFGY